MKTSLHKQPRSFTQSKTALIALQLLCIASLLPALHPAYGDTKADLNAGKILVVSVPGNTGILPARGMAVVNAPPEHVFHLIADLGSYAKFVPRMISSKVLIAGRRFELAAKVPWPLNQVSASLQLQTWQRGPLRTARWKMLKGTLKRYEGSAWVQPWGKAQSVVIYEMLAIPSFPAPEALITRGLRNAVREVIQAIRTRATRPSA